MPNVVVLRTQLFQAFLQTLQMVGIAGSISLLQIRTASLSSNMTATSAWRTSPLTN